MKIESNCSDLLFFFYFLIDILSGPEKMRRMVEVLRSDVVRGLGVKLLERVYSIMEEEDEVKREVNALQARFLELFDFLQTTS